MTSDFRRGVSRFCAAYSRREGISPQEQNSSVSLMNPAVTRQSAVVKLRFAAEARRGRGGVRNALWPSQFDTSVTGSLFHWRLPRVMPNLR